MRRLTLSEYQVARAVPLTPSERDALRTHARDLAISPTVGVEGCYDLRPGAWVGSVALDTVRVEIRPKLAVERLLFLLAYTLDPRAWQDVPFDYAAAENVLEAIIPAFVVQLRRALRRGVLQGYQEREEALPTVRGRPRFDEQIRRHFGIVPPIEVRHDEFTEDIELNRLLKAAIGRLAQLPIRSADARRGLRAFDMALASVQRVAYDARQIPTIAYTRLTEHYRPAVELARLILRASSFDLGHGKVRAATFLVNMNELFENFVVVALREALQVSSRAFIQGARGRRLRLDSAGMVTLEPDLSWWENGICLFVGDVKYKWLEASGIKHPDLYQLLAYTIATGLPRGLLIYATGESRPVIHTIAMAGKELEIMALDLDCPPTAVLAQMGVVAENIRGMRLRYEAGLRAHGT